MNDYCVVSMRYRQVISTISSRKALQEAKIPTQRNPKVDSIPWFNLI